MNNTGVAARRRGYSVHLVGVEGDKGHIRFAHEACAANGFAPEQTTIIHGVAASRHGIALFPRQEQSGHQWGLEPIFDASPIMRDKALATGSHDALSMIPLSQLLGKRERFDLLHIGFKAEKRISCAAAWTFFRAELLTWSSALIRAKLRATIRRLAWGGWCLKIERPALIKLESGTPVVDVDGVQGWRNLHLIPH